MFSRDITTELKKCAEQYPIVTITGPRQSGKTTLCRLAFSEKPYINLEHLETREFALTDPIGFLNTVPNGAILDEVQNVPQLLSYLQVLVDEKRTNNLFILTGSCQFELIQALTQSLAGRTALLTLLPFSYHEIRSKYPPKNVIDLIYQGFYPRIYDQKLNPTQALDAYFKTYLERDLRNLSQIHNLSLFLKFVKLCAGRIGQLLNLSNIANDLGVSHTMVRNWLTLLEASYIIFLLEPFNMNINKRLIKSPKLYFYDVGLASYLLGIENTNHLQTHPLRGNLYENLIVAELLKYRMNQVKPNNLTFFRDSKGNEIDLIYQIADQVILIEIKAGETISSEYFKNFIYFETNIKKSQAKVLVYSGSKNEIRQNIYVTNLSNLTDILNQF